MISVMLNWLFYNNSLFVNGGTVYPSGKSVNHMIGTHDVNYLMSKFKYLLNAGDKKSF